MNERTFRLPRLGWVIPHRWISVALWLLVIYHAARYGPSTLRFEPSAADREPLALRVALGVGWALLVLAPSIAAAFRLEKQPPRDSDNVIAWVLIVMCALTLFGMVGNAVILITAGPGILTWRAAGFIAESVVTAVILGFAGAALRQRLLQHRRFVRFDAAFGALNQVYRRTL